MVNQDLRHLLMMWKPRLLTTLTIVFMTVVRLRQTTLVITAYLRSV